MKTQYTASLSIEKPGFRILLVEDDNRFREGFIQALTEVGACYYELEIDEASSVERGIHCLANARESAPYDGVILDFQLPASERDRSLQRTLTLNMWCFANPRIVRWVAQLTAWEEDPELKKFWEAPERLKGEYFGGIYAKTPADLIRLRCDLFFPEVKNPLRSDWLPIELGAVEAPLCGLHPNTPAGFNIYRFIHRLGTVWPDLDEVTRERARSLFSIKEAGEFDPPKRIGLRAFTSSRQSEEGTE